MPREADRDAVRWGWVVKRLSRRSQRFAVAFDDQTGQALVYAESPRDAAEAFVRDRVDALQAHIDGGAVIVSVFCARKKAGWRFSVYIETTVSYVVKQLHGGDS